MDDIKNPSMADFDDGDIPAALRRMPKGTDLVPDEPIEIERQIVTVEEEGGIPTAVEPPTE